MGEAPARIWYQQARSDWNASIIVCADDNAGAYCQAISKHQQAVEKAIKAMLAALRDRGFLMLPTLKRHTVKSELMEITSAMMRAPRSHRTRELIHHVQNLLHLTHQSHINELCDLAPHWPNTGLLPRNTEYPYQVNGTTWKAPCDPSAFTKSEYRKYRSLARTIVEGAGKVIAAAERSPSH